jgi:hypothetical protein
MTDNNTCTNGCSVETKMNCLMIAMNELKKLHEEENTIPEIMNLSEEEKLNRRRTHMRKFFKVSREQYREMTGVDDPSEGE